MAIFQKKKIIQLILHHKIDFESIYILIFMNKRFLITLAIGSALVLTACNSGGERRNPGKVYGPDMTYSRAYDPYTSNPNFKDSLTSRIPEAGTIARGMELPEHIAESDTTAWYALQSPYKFTEGEIAEGQRLYDIYCGICHGQKLDGNGPLYKGGEGPFAAAPPNFKGDNYLHMPIGKMYHAVVYGKNMMGSYASQLDTKHRWQVLAYIKKFQSENGGDAFTLSADGTNTNTTAPVSDTAKAASTTDSSVVKK